MSGSPTCGFFTYSKKNGLFACLRGSWGEGLVVAVVLSKILCGYTGRQHPEVQPLSLSHTIFFFREKVPPSFNNPSIGNF